MSELEMKQMQKIDAEIAKLIAETSKINKGLDAEVAKVIAETSKLNKETFWHPMILVAALFAGIGAIVKFLV
jgi:hypothetical protein